ncbi:hypothetical protein BC826DRAFT_1108607 [Russula brevipes]|nr:hypothetical protein BC826DRAFT_1108607 [Russula brevipes]
MHQPPIKSSKIEKYNTQDPIVDEAVLKDQLGLYAEQKGLFLLSFLTFARLSPDGASSHVARVSAIPPETWVPGVVEQYALQLAKLGSGMASLEIVSMPTYFSRPGMKMALSGKAIHHNRGNVESPLVSWYYSLDTYGSPRATGTGLYYEDDLVNLQNIVGLANFVRVDSARHRLSETLSRRSRIKQYKFDCPRAYIPVFAMLSYVSNY